MAKEHLKDNEKMELQYEIASKNEDGNIDYLFGSGGNKVVDKPNH